MSNLSNVMPGPEGGLEILPAMQSVLDNVGAITKDKQTKGGSRFNFRGIDDVYLALHPLFREAGIIILTAVLQEQRDERVNDRGTVLAFTRLLMRFSFVSTKDGSQMVAVTQGEAMDSGDKSSNKAMSVAMKYAMFQAFTIPTEQVDDPDAEVHTVRAPGMTDEQREAIDGLKAYMTPNQETWWEKGPDISEQKAAEVLKSLQGKSLELADRQAGPDEGDHQTPVGT